MATLVVEVVSRGINQTRTQLNSLTGAATKATASIAGLVSVGATINKLVQSGRQLSVFQASLTTMTGSAENATKAFRELERFAATTPYTLDQAVNGFNKLVALGLDPSREALESYGNTAAAMGKDLTQLIEAVADAATGEFERLKEFGIKAKNQGDTIAFTFRGVRTEVQNNAAAIEGYLQGIGNSDFSGAMAERMATLDGALSNLKDSWDGLFRTVSQAGTGELIEDSARAAIDALDELSAMIGSGQLQGYIAAWAESWKFALEDIANGNREAISFIIGGWDELFRFIDIEGRGSAQVLSDAFWQFPANIRAIVQIATVEIAALADKAAAYGAEITDSLNPFGDGGDYDGMQARLAAVNDARMQSIEAILAERDATVAAYRVKIQSADEARRAYEDERKAAFDLGQFRVGGDSGASGGTIDKRLQKEKESAASLLEEIERLGANESEIVGYWYEDNLAQLNDYLEQRLISQQEYNAAQEQLLNESVERQLAIDDRLNEQRRSAEQRRTDEVRREVESQYAAEAEGAREKERQFDRAADAQSSLTDQLGATLGKQNAIYKASAIMTATIDTYKAATGAYASLSSIPVVGPALGAAAAGAAIGFGLAQVKAITSTPNRAQGGQVLAGQPYDVGEYGRETFVPSSNGMIVPNSQLGGAIFNFTIIDQSTNGGNSVSVRQLTERDVEIIIADRVPRLMAEQQADPYSPFSRTQRSTTSTSRRL